MIIMSKFSLSDLRAFAPFVQSLSQYQQEHQVPLMIVVMGDVEETILKHALKKKSAQHIQVQHLMRFIFNATLEESVQSSEHVSPDHHVVFSESIANKNTEEFRDLLTKRFDKIISQKYIEEWSRSFQDREELSQATSSPSRSSRHRM